MSRITYQRQPNDEVVEFEGKVYCAKEAWTLTKGGRTYSTRGVEEGVEALDDGTFPAVDIEAFKNDDGSWDVIGVWGPEQIDETGGEYGYLVWSEEKGFEYDYYGCTSCHQAEV